MAIGSLGAILYLRHIQSERQNRAEAAKSELEKIIVNGDALGMGAAPGNHIERLLADNHGRKLLMGLDEEHQRLAFDPLTDAYACIWSGPDGQQTLLFDPGSNPCLGLTSGMYSQVTITKVHLKDREVFFEFTLSSDDKDKDFAEFLGLQPGEVYRSAAKMSDLSGPEFINVWKAGTPISTRDAKITQQDGAGQPATRSESDSEGGKKPQQGSEGRSR